MSRVKLRVWLEGAIVAALAIVLSMVPTNIGSSFTISLGMIPMTIYCLRRGFKAGLFAGLMWGLMHFLVGNVVYLSVSQVLIEYPIAFTFAGFSGLLMVPVQKSLTGKRFVKTAGLLFIASLVGCTARFFWHFIAGVIFWGQYALWGMNPWQFSFVMNGISGLATAFATFIVVLLIVQTYPKAVLIEDKKS